MSERPHTHLPGHEPTGGVHNHLSFSHDFDPYGMHTPAAVERLHTYLHRHDTAPRCVPAPLRVPALDETHEPEGRAVHSAYPPPRGRSLQTLRAAIRKVIGGSSDAFVEVVSDSTMVWGDQFVMQRLMAPAVVVVVIDRNGRLLFWETTQFNVDVIDQVKTKDRFQITEDHGLVMASWPLSPEVRIDGNLVIRTAPDFPIGQDDGDA